VSVSLRLLLIVLLLNLLGCQLHELALVVCLMLLMKIFAKSVVAGSVELISCRVLSPIIIDKLLVRHVLIKLNLRFEALIDDWSQAVGWRKLVKLHIVFHHYEI
jgi:hypothetical protein